MAKHRDEIDQHVPLAAGNELGTKAVEDTVDLALEPVGTRRAALTRRRLDILARSDLADRDRAWR